MQSTEIMQLENLEQLLSSEKHGIEYMSSHKFVDSNNLIWALFSDFKSHKEFASKTAVLTESELFRNVLFLFQRYLSSASFSSSV